MIEALDMLSTRAALAVLTNKPLAPTRAILDGLDLSRFFDADAIVGGDGPFPRKPDPAGLLFLGSRSGTAMSQTLLVGDSAVDYRTARNASASICLARYGFGTEGVGWDEVGAADLEIAAPDELVSAVRF